MLPQVALELFAYETGRTGAGDVREEYGLHFKAAGAWGATPLNQ